MIVSTSVVCLECGIPFTRTGAARSSGFYRTHAENDTCICCREGLDPVTLEPLAARGEPTMKIRIARIGPPADHLGTIVAPGAIPAGVAVPLCEDFDPMLTPIGQAVVHPDGTADLELRPGIELDAARLTGDDNIGIGYRVLEQHHEGGVRVIDRLELMAVGVNKNLIKRAGDGV